MAIYKGHSYFQKTIKTLKRKVCWNYYCKLITFKLIIKQHKFRLSYKLIGFVNIQANIFINYM